MKDFTQMMIGASSVLQMVPIPSIRIRQRGPTQLSSTLIVNRQRRLRSLSGTVLFSDDPAADDWKAIGNDLRIELCKSVSASAKREQGRE